jgi:hypothetical protein
MVFHTYINQMHGPKRKSSVKFLALLVAPCIYDSSIRRVQMHRTTVNTTAPVTDSYVTYKQTIIKPAVRDVTRRVFCVNVFGSKFRDRFQRSNFKYGGRPVELHCVLQIFISATFIERHRTNGFEYCLQL